MTVEIGVGGGWLTLVGPGVASEQRRLDEAAVEQIRGFAETYRALLGKREAQAQLLVLGRQLYDWLDGEEHWLQRVRSARPLVLELRAPAAPDANEWAVLHAPWELLADERGFLAQDAVVAELPEGPRNRFERVRALVDAALAFFGPGGMFASYSHFDRKTGPARARLPAGQPGTNVPAAPSGPSPRIIVGDDWVNIGSVVLRRRKPTSQAPRKTLGRR
jgi:hypothetical protein